jgi:hypothetical protein
MDLLGQGHFGKVYLFRVAKDENALTAVKIYDVLKAIKHDYARYIE